MTKTRRLLSWLLALIILATPLVVWRDWNGIYDWYRLRNYTPPTSITALATQDDMTAKSEHLYYVNRPQLVGNVNTFHADCPSSEQTIVLGCYAPHETGIYIYKITDPQLDGIEQVTAAHEMLHAAYERLRSKDRNYVDGLLTSYYQNDVHDQRIIDTINAYKKTEPNDVVDEMHSVFGTEIANLPAPLENYYKVYFTNRSVVTNFAAGYQAQFTNRLNQINADDATLTTMKNQINSEEQSLRDQLAQIQTDRSRLDSERSSSQFGAYNSNVPAFNSEVSAYNQGVDQLKADIATYNDLVTSRNAIASELRGLDQAIDTRLTAQPAQ